MIWKLRVPEKQLFYINFISLQSIEAIYNGELELKHSITTHGASTVNNVAHRKPNQVLHDVQKLAL